MFDANSIDWYLLNFAMIDFYDQSLIIYDSPFRIFIGEKITFDCCHLLFLP